MLAAMMSVPPDDHRHEVLSLSHQLEGQSVLLLGNDVLRKLEEQVEPDDGVDGLHQELQTQDSQGYDQ